MKDNKQKRIVSAQRQWSVAAVLAILVLLVLSLLNGVFHTETVLPGTINAFSSTSRVLNFAPHFEALLDACGISGGEHTVISLSGIVESTEGPMTSLVDRNSHEEMGATSKRHFSASIDEPTDASEMHDMNLNSMERPNKAMEVTSEVQIYDDGHGKFASEAKQFPIVESTFTVVQSRSRKRKRNME